ncbi:MAG: hypothetical protein E7I68_04250, partial [Neisseria sp.]|nr:hypothetical protein [Neisseria sp.]
PSSKTVNSQTAKNSTKTDNNLKFNNFYFRYYFKTFKTPSIPNPNNSKPPTYTSTNNKGRLKSLSDDLWCPILHHILPILLIQKITLPNITSPR